MIIKVSNNHMDRINIERMIERINKSIVTINHSVDTLEREDDSKKHMKNACEYAKEIDTKIKEQKKILHRYQNERSTYIARLNNCGLFDRHLKKYFKNEIAKLNFKILQIQEKINTLQHEFDIHTSNYIYYKKWIPTQQEKDSARFKHKNTISYEYNPQIILLNNMTGLNLPTADAKKFETLETIHLEFVAANNTGRYHYVSIDQSNTEDEME